jgi:hypothetical protein
MGLQTMWLPHQGSRSDVLTLFDSSVIGTVDSGLSPCPMYFEGLAMSGNQPNNSHLLSTNFSFRI